MSKASAPLKIIKQITKTSDRPLLDPKIRLFRIENNRFQFHNNFNLDPKIRCFTDGKNPTNLSQVRAGAELDRLARRKSKQALKSTSAAVGRGSKDPSKSPTQTFQPEGTPKDPESESAIRAFAEAFEAKKREQSPGTDSRIITANMSSQLTKVLAKDACPRK